MSRILIGPIAAAVLACAANCLAAAESPPPQAPQVPQARATPRIGLVLSGGGARGLAHIGVLKVLREHRVPVDFIVATSMGSIVGGAYAAGHTPEEMEALVAGADWDLMFSDRPPRRDLSFRRKEDDLRFIGRGELGIKNGGIVLPRGALGAQNLEEFLRTVSRPASDSRRLDSFPIAFRAVATDLETGKPVVLSDVPLSVAMRASMSIPGAFAPTRIEGRLLGDGGLTRNLPVEVARDLGADVIIAVNVGTPLLPRESLDSAFGVAQQMINILTEQNVELSLAALREKDVLISPDLAGVTFLDFERGPELIARGEAAARAVAARLAPLALGEKEFDLWEFRRTRHPVDYDRDVQAVVVAGAERSNPEALKREVARRTGIVAGESVSDEQLVKAARILHGSGDFERVDVYAQDADKRRSVVIEVDEKSWGPDYLRIGGRAVTDLESDGRFSLTLQHTRTWVNSWGAEWRNELEIGDLRRLATSFYQPLAPGSAWFVEPVLQAAQSNFDLFTNGNRRTDRITHATVDASAAIGRSLGGIGVARLRVGHQWLRTSPYISSRLESSTRDRATYANLGATFDTLDDANFPRAGYLVSADTNAISYKSDPGGPVHAVEASGLFPFTWGRLTVLGILSGARSRDDRGGFHLGGLFNLSGTPLGAIAGPRAGLAEAIVYYRMGALPRGIGRAWYAGFSVEAGNTWRSTEHPSTGGVKKAASIFAGIDSIIGPLYFGYGKTSGGGSSLYLFLGRPTDRN